MTSARALVIFFGEKMNEAKYKLGELIATKSFYDELAIIIRIHEHADPDKAFYLLKYPNSNKEVWKSEEELIKPTIKGEKNGNV